MHLPASRSANAANDIRKLIDASASKLQSGAEQVHAAGRTMDDIVEQVKNVTQLIAQISHATSRAGDRPDRADPCCGRAGQRAKNADLVEKGNAQFPRWLSTGPDAKMRLPCCIKKCMLR